MTAGVPAPRFRDQLAEVLEEHRLSAFCGTESACACDHKWRTNRDYRLHVAAHVEARVQAEVRERAPRDDLDRYIVEQSRDPEFRRAFAEAQGRPAKDAQPADGAK